MTLLGYLTETFAYAQAYAGRILAACIIVSALEFLLPRSRHSWVSRVRGALFWATYIAITALGITLFVRFWSGLGYKPLVHVDLSMLSKSENPFTAAVGGILTSLIFVQIGEFFYYWFHRLQHSNSFFWRFHAEHHAIEEMNAFNSNHHFTEELFRLPFVTIPILILFSFEQTYVPWLWATVLGWQGIYQHSCTKLNFGWLRYIIPDNRFHRIHHSFEPHHFNRNFGSGSAVWDIVFRTIWHPRAGEWPSTGVSGLPEATTVRDFLLRPFLRSK